MEKKEAIDSAHASLLQLVESASEKSRTHAKRNDALATFCYFLAVVSSFVAAVVVYANAWQWLSALVTAVPGTALLTNSVFSFERKSEWHRRRLLNYRSLLLRLRYEGADILEISGELRRLEEEFQQSYPGFGSFSSEKKSS